MFSSYAACLAQRRRLIADDTTAFRVIDGAGDGLDGVFADQLGDRIMVSTRDSGIPAVLLGELRELHCPVFHKKLDRDDKRPPIQVAGDATPGEFDIYENGVRLRMDMGAGYSQGLFLDQRDNRRKVRERVSPGDTVLNTFAYTGAFSIYAALSGAVTTTLDLARPSLEWARINYTLNGIDPEEHYFCKGDTFHWLERFARQGRVFDGIILDPPTFSRNERGRVFRVEKHYGDLVALASRCLAPRGWMLCTTNCRNLAPGHFRQLVADGCGDADITAAPMPADFTGEQYLKTIWINY